VGARKPHKAALAATAVFRSPRRFSAEAVTDLLCEDLAYK